MTQRIIICILLLVTVSPVFNRASGGRQRVSAITEMHSVSQNQQTEQQVNIPVSMPVIPAPKPEPPHGKTARIPHFEEIPHIHRYHKERVKKIRRHTPFWLLSQVLVAVCNLSLLVIAFLHLTH